MDRRAVVSVMVGAGLALSACSGSTGDGGSAIRVMREGRAGQDFGSVQLACTVTAFEPPGEGAALDCVHGDPDVDGFEIGASLTASPAELPAGTTLEQGVDFQVHSIAGAEDGSPWGASGFSSWWTGDLMIVLEERTAEGQGAVLEGTMQTTAEVEVTPITVVFEAARATLP